jgi:hypothetical protein
LEDDARDAVSAFVRESHEPARDKGQVSALKNAAVCAAAANLKRQEQIANNAEKVRFATRLLRQGLETKQGVAETGNDLATEKISEPFRMEQRLAERWYHQPNKPLTAEEKLKVLLVMFKAMAAADGTADEWADALLINMYSDHERYGDADICRLEFDNAVATLVAIGRIAAKAETYVELLDRAAQQATKNR